MADNKFIKLASGRIISVPEAILNMTIYIDPEFLHVISIVMHSIWKIPEPILGPVNLNSSSHECAIPMCQYENDPSEEMFICCQNDHWIHTKCFLALHHQICPLCRSGLLLGFTALYCNPPCSEMQNIGRKHLIYPRNS